MCYVLQYRLLVCFGQSGIHIRETKGRNELKAGQISKFVPLSEDNKESSKEFQGDDNGRVEEDVWGLGLSCLDVDVEYGSGVNRYFLRCRMLILSVDLI